MQLLYKGWNVDKFSVYHFILQNIIMKLAPIINLGLMMCLWMFTRQKLPYISYWASNTYDMDYSEFGNANLLWKIFHNYDTPIRFPTFSHVFSISMTLQITCWTQKFSTITTRASVFRHLIMCSPSTWLCKLHVELKNFPQSRRANPFSDIQSCDLPWHDVANLLLNLKCCHTHYMWIQIQLLIMWDSPIWLILNLWHQLTWFYELHATFRIVPQR